MVRFQSNKQWNQMARLFFQYLAIYNSENWPNNIKQLPY